MTTEAGPSGGVDGPWGRPAWPVAPVRRSVPAGVDPVDLALAGMRRVAVVGLSPDPWRESHGVAAALQRDGYEVVPVNPHVEEVLGAPAFPDLASVPGRVDVVCVFRRTEHLAGVAEEAVARDDVAAVWNQLGLRSPAAAATAATAGRAYVEDRCLKVEVARRRARPPTGPRVDAPVVLVDLDGTVLDYERAERAALLTTLAEFGVDGDGDAVTTYRRINREHWARLEQGDITATELRTARWAAFLTDRGVTADGAAASRRYLELLAASEDLVPGARAALWWMGRRSRLVALTNGFDDVQRGRLSAAGLTTAFDGYMSSESAGAAKPDPAIVDAALETVGAAALDRRHVVVVGDQLGADVAVGAAVGATTVWIAHDGGTVPAGLPAPDHTVRSIAELA